MRQNQDLCPLDGRYASEVSELVPIFSEYGLVRNRVMIEIRYVLALLPIVNISLTQSDKRRLEGLFDNFSFEEYGQIKKIEKNIQHDVKAVEIWIGENLQKMGLGDLKRFVHFGLTSEDINNFAYTTQLNEGNKVLISQLQKVGTSLVSLIEENQNLVMLGRTHGQPALPTVFAKEVMVFLSQFVELGEKIRDYSFRAKLTGAVGTLAAHRIAYPEVDWLKFSNDFVKAFGYEPVMLTTQILPPNGWVELFSLWRRLSMLLRSMAENFWWYVSMEYFDQELHSQEVGSSTMPQKVNPIHLENCEGNAEVASMWFELFERKFSHSRLQRDLSDSTVRRNFGIAYGYLLVSLRSLDKGLCRLKPNAERMLREVQSHPEILAEAYQTILRREAYPEGDAYEVIKKAFRGGSSPTVDSTKELFSELHLSEMLQKELLSLSPEEYLGYGSELVKESLPVFKKRIKKLVNNKEIL